MRFLGCISRWNSTNEGYKPGIGLNSINHINIFIDGIDCSEIFYEIQIVQIWQCKLIKKIYLIIFKQLNCDSYQQHIKMVILKSNILNTNITVTQPTRKRLCVHKLYNLI